MSNLSATRTTVSNYVIKKGGFYVKGWGPLGLRKEKQFLWTNNPKRAWVFKPGFAEGRTDLPDMPPGAKKVKTELIPHY